MSPDLRGDDLGGTPNCGARGPLDGGHPRGTVAPPWVPHCHQVEHPILGPEGHRSPGLLAPLPRRQQAGPPSTQEAQMVPLRMDGGHVAMGYLSARSCWQMSSTSVWPGPQGLGVDPALLLLSMWGSRAQRRALGHGIRPPRAPGSSPPSGPSIGPIWTLLAVRESKELPTEIGRPTPRIATEESTFQQIGRAHV